MGAHPLAGRQSRAGLDHAQTGWPLEGAHKGDALHEVPQQGNTRGNPTFLGLVARRALSCHKDHEGRFGRTCTSCHDATRLEGCVDLKTFNHDLAGYPSRERTQPCQCAKCHSDPPKYTGLKFAACTDCHKDPHAGGSGRRAPTATTTRVEAGDLPAQG